MRHTRDESGRFAPGAGAPWTQEQAKAASAKAVERKRVIRREESRLALLAGAASINELDSELAHLARKAARAPSADGPAMKAYMQAIAERNAPTVPERGGLGALIDLMPESVRSRLDELLADASNPGSQWAQRARLTREHQE